MRPLFQKRIIFFSFFLIFFLFGSCLYFYQEYLTSIDTKFLIDKYFVLKDVIDQNKVFYGIIYVLISILWISVLGFITPMLVLSTLMFGYLGSILSIFSFTTGSIFSFLLAQNLRVSLKNIFKNIRINNNAFFLFIIFRFIPGNPFIIKNFAGAFFNLKLKSFILATLIAEIPQIFLFTYILKKLIDSSERIFNNFEIAILYEELTLPFSLMFLFVIFLFLINIKFRKKIFKN